MTTTLHPWTLVCPVCRSALQWSQQTISCTSCAAEYQYVDGVPDLIVGERFADDEDLERNTYEECSNTFLADRYLVPTFTKLLVGRQAPRILSLGCGNGIDVDRLTAAGFRVAGIDCGNRSVRWAGRAQRASLYLANGRHLPFEDGTFDLVYCGCVFPHVGVEGDSTRVAPGYRQARLDVAREIVRVLTPDGLVMVSSPNRWCPLDLFHGRRPGQPLPLLNPPTRRFLLSAGDYRQLFMEAGCARARLLPVTDYWGFVRMKQRRVGRLMALPVETVFRMVSTGPLAFLRASPINPWLVMLMEKDRA